jgi:hypothetical protein
MALGHQACHTVTRCPLHIPKLAKEHGQIWKTKHCLASHLTQSLHSPLYCLPPTEFSDACTISGQPVHAMHKTAKFVATHCAVVHGASAPCDLRHARRRPCVHDQMNRRSSLVWSVAAACMLDAEFADGPLGMHRQFRRRFFSSKGSDFRRWHANESPRVACGIRTCAAAATVGDETLSSSCYLLLALALLCLLHSTKVFSVLCARFSPLRCHLKFYRLQRSYVCVV